jgi:asparagine synthase (glutamine-hydrolysing)
MPGVVGVVTKQPAGWAQVQVRQMVAGLNHGAENLSGTWSDAQMGVYAGWVSRRGSFSAAMPLRNERGDRTLIFAGEEYPDPQSVRQLRERGHQFAATGADYLVHLSEEDLSFPKSLNGRFHGLLIDASAGAVTLFNDRYGMHRVYYYESPEAFYFAAEAKAILAVVPNARAADLRGLGEFVACGCVLENRTIFRDISALPPSSAWRFTDGTLKSKGTYFHPSEWEAQGPLDPEAYYAQLREVFSRNLPRYFEGPEKIGISLTGGLDTRMIMAWSKATPGSLASYTFGGPFRECEDVRIARKVAEIDNQPFEIIPVASEFLSRFHAYAERAVYLSDGCAAVNRASDLYANELAAEIAPVRLTGNYGSEILRRLRAFKPSSPAQGLFDSQFLTQVDLARQTYGSILDGHAVSFACFRQAPWYQYGLLSLEQTQLSVRSPFLDNDLVQTAFRAPKSEMVKSDIFEDNDDCARLIADGNPALSQLPTDRGLGGRHSWKTPLSRALLEFTFKAEYAYDYGMPQWLARLDHALAWVHLERAFLGRHKFAHYRVWYRDSLSAYVKEVLLDPRTLSRPYIQRNQLETIVEAHVKGTHNYTTEIHRLLTLELQHRLFIDADSFRL